MKVTFKLKSKPISTNNAYYARNRSFNEKARQWRYNFLKQLQNDYNQKQIDTIRNHFDPTKHMLSVVFTWFQPQAKLITKKGHLSLASMDVDNCLKIPTDCLFDQKYNDVWLSKRKGRESELYNDFKHLRNLRLNDKFIFSTTSIKFPSMDDQYHCSIDVEIVPLFSLPKSKAKS
jgi:Holliday junction resolvase RusA-like endonuclease